jgi:hypothetical protein
MARLFREVPDKTEKFGFIKFFGLGRFHVEHFGGSQE